MYDITRETKPQYFLCGLFVFIIMIMVVIDVTVREPDAILSLWIFYRLT